jgi:hypothetical protein
VDRAPGLTRGSQEAGAAPFDVDMLVLKKGSGERRPSAVVRDTGDFRGADEAG